MDIIKCRHIYFSEGLVNEYNSLKIAVCDSHQELLQLLTLKIYEILDEENIQGEVDQYLKADQFFESETAYDIIFLCIDMSENNGLKTAEEVKRKHLYSKLILLSEGMEYIQDAFKVQAFRYLLRTDERERIKEAICSAFIADKERMGIVLEEGSKFYSIFLKDILYIAALGDEIVIITKREEQYIVRMTLKSIYCLLECDFMKCSREKIVNIRHIREVREREVILDNGLSIVVSYREKKNAKEKWKAYLFQVMETMI